MKKQIMMMSLILSVMSIANGVQSPVSPNKDYDVSNISVKIDQNKFDTEYKKIDNGLQINNTDLNHIANIPSTPDDSENSTGSQQFSTPNPIVQNYYIKKTDGKITDMIAFTSPDPNMNDVEAIKKAVENVPKKNGDKNGYNLIALPNTNNKPLFMYMFDRKHNKIVKVYKPTTDLDGNLHVTRASIRQIVSENVMKFLNELKTNPNAELQDGYIKANELHLLGVGEIKDTTKGLKSTKDRALDLVSGKTVYDYLEKEKKDGDLSNPKDKFITDTKVKAELDKLKLGQGQTEFTKTDRDNESSIIQYKEKNNKDVVYRGVANPELNNDAANKGYVDAGDKKLKDEIDKLKVQGNVEFNYTTDDKGNKILEYSSDKGVNKIYRGVATPIQENDAANKGYVDKLVGDMRVDLNKAMAGTSTAIAIASVPLEFKPNTKNAMGAGVGYYGKHMGFALAYGRKFVNNDITFKASTSFNTAGQFGAGTGLGFTW